MRLIPHFYTMKLSTWWLTIQWTTLPRFIVATRHTGQRGGALAGINLKNF